MKRVFSKYIVGVGIILTLLATGCTSAGTSEIDVRRELDSRPPCATVVVDKNSAKTAVDENGDEHKTYNVTIKFNKKFGSATAIAPDYEAPRGLESEIHKAKDKNVIKLRLPTNRYTLHGNGYGEVCNPVFGVPRI